MNQRNGTNREARLQTQRVKGLVSINGIFVKHMTAQTPGNSDF